MQSIDEQTYRQLPALSASDIKEIYRSPAHYKASLDQPREPTPAMELGTACHMAILEPDKFSQRYMMIEDADICRQIGGSRPRSTTRYKEWYAGVVLDNPGKQIIGDADYRRIQDVAAAVRGHRIAGQLLSEPGTAEMFLEWEHPETGTKMKGRPDWYMQSGRLVDIKTCEDARMPAFSRSIWNYLYHIQAAVYFEGIRETTGQIVPFTWIAVEKDPPYALCVYDIHISTLELGQTDADRCIHIYEQCIKTGLWPAYYEEIREIQLPSWAGVTEVA